MTGDRAKRAELIEMLTWAIGELPTYPPADGAHGWSTEMVEAWEAKLKWVWDAIVKEDVHAHKTKKGQSNG